MRPPHRSKLLAILGAALAVLPARALADDGPRVFLDETKLGITWRLPGGRWAEKDAPDAPPDRLARVQRQSDGMTVTASVHRRIIPKQAPSNGQLDPLQTATDLVGCRSGTNPRADLGRHDVFARPGIRGAYAVGEFKKTDPAGRAMALVLVRDPDYVWLEAAGPAKLLDDTEMVDELLASLEATPFAETDPRVFFEDKDLGIAWRLPAKRWFGQGKAVGLRDRLAVAQRGAEDMTIEAWLYRRAHPPAGRPDAYEEARRLCASVPHARFKQHAFEPGRYQMLKVPGVRGAYATGEAKDATPPLRSVAVLLVRETDSVWLIAWGPAKILDDAAVADLAASLEVDPAAKPDATPR